jgi:UDP-glucose:(heptosyl)LPS alpha-1,3-glucosyltransferase
VDPAAVVEGLIVHRIPLSKPRTLNFLRATSSIRLNGHDLVQGFGRTLGHDIYRAGGGVHPAWLEASGNTAYTKLRGVVSPNEWLARYIDRRAMVEARIVICNSNYGAAQVRAWYGLEGQRVRVIRNGVDGDRFRPRPEVRAQLRRRWGAVGRVVVFVGNGFRRKGLRVAGRAFARVAAPADRFVVVGGDAHAEQAIRPLRRLLGEQLIAVGPVSDPENYMAAADATVLPTLYDSAANTTLESLSCGVPPVTSSRDGNAEIVPDKRLIAEDPQDVGAVSAAIHYALSESSWVNRCRSVAEEWTVARNGAAVEDAYREYVDG